MKKIFLLPFLALSVLFTYCSDDNDNNPNSEEKVVEEQKETISKYENIELKLIDSDSNDYGVAFSSSTGKTYKESEINTDNIKEIDIVSFNLQAFISFESPSESDYTKEIEGATSTKIQPINVNMTVEEFNAIEDAEALKKLEIINTDEALPYDYKGIILFENAAGKKGAIKINAMNRARILFDVKVMN